MYKALKIFYLIFIYLIYKKRRKLVNVFTLILKSHEIKLNDIVKAFVKFIQQLNRETKLKINDNMKTMCVFVIIFLNNIF